MKINVVTETMREIGARHKKYIRIACYSPKVGLGNVNGVDDLLLLIYWDVVESKPLWRGLIFRWSAGLVVHGTDLAKHRLAHLPVERLEIDV